MPSYGVWRTLGALVAASGIVAIIVAFALPPSAGNDLVGALAVFGFGALIFGGVGALWAQTRLRIDAAEARGGDVAAAATGDPRWRGGALALLGFVLVAIMVTLITATEPLLLFPGRGHGGARFTGTREQGLGLLALFAGLLVFGAAAMVYGVWQVRTGRQDRRVMLIATALGALVFGIVALL